MTQEKYTQKKVNKNIHTLQSEKDLLIKKRNNINEQIKRNNQQIKYWENLDLMQSKLF